MSEEYNNPIILKIYRHRRDISPYEYSFESESEPRAYGTKEEVLEDLSEALDHMKSEIA